jgi:hypothetical protein
VPIHTPREGRGESEITAIKADLARPALAK